jgi:hypothetical protein
MPKKNDAGVINSKFDAGDLISGIFATFGISGITGIGSSTLYGVSISDQMISLGATSIPISYGLLVMSLVVAFATNADLSALGLIRRPGWEKATVLVTLLLPWPFMFAGGLRTWMLASYVNGTVVSAPMLLGWVIVGYRRQDDKEYPIRFWRAFGGA